MKKNREDLEKKQHKKERGREGERERGREGERKAAGVGLEDVLMAWSVGPIPIKHLISLIKSVLA